MSREYESARLILELYQLRREPKMREARTWFLAQWPKTPPDLVEMARGENNTLFRMATSYWDMACSLVNNGAIEARMFHDSMNEHVFMYAKVVRLLPEFRATVGQPRFLAQLEKCVQALPDLADRLAYFEKVRERMLAQAQAQAATAAAAGAGR